MTSNKQKGNSNTSEKQKLQIDVKKKLSYDKETNYEDKGKYGKMSSHIPDSVEDFKSSVINLPPITDKRSIINQEVDSKVKRDKDLEISIKIKDQQNIILQK